MIEAAVVIILLVFGVATNLKDDARKCEPPAICQEQR